MGEGLEAPADEGEVGTEEGSGGEGARGGGDEDRDSDYYLDARPCLDHR